MRFTLALTVAAAVANAASLTDVCTPANVKASLPSDGSILGLTIDPVSLTVNTVMNASTSGQNMYPDAVFSFCNITFAYTHNGRNDQVLLNYWLPAPANFQNRYLSTGGGGLAINSGLTTSGSLPGGVQYGAVSGLTDGGFGGFTKQFDSVFLLANGTVNWEETFMFGYQAHHELNLIGKAFTKQFFNLNSTKLYSYYQGCSEGGREGWSQVQRFAGEFDGVITGAPAFRYAFQQTQHLYSNVVEQTLGYYPSPCEFDKITNETIAACDPLDGKTDGVVARTDLCKLHFNASSIIGKPYYCAASSGGGGPPGRKRQFPGGGASTPTQNGTVTAQGVAVANKIIDGLVDSEGKRVYLSYQPAAASFADATTAYNAATQSWELSVTGLGAEWVTRFLDLQNTSSISSANFANVTYDTLKNWMIQGLNFYQDTLHTAWPDLTPFQQGGGKVLHFHGESDDSIPPASSVRYHESVRKIMYPHMAYNASQEAIGQWYRLFLVPGAQHCAPGTLQPNGAFPQTNLAVMINWVEKGVVPTTLNATVLRGANKGDKSQICAWPLRPFWPSNNATMQCVYDQSSIDNWNYDFDGVKVPVY
ncbi:Tannase [Lachnellula suecica]|uniref:Carboxylic ester hydrolase n=1 Tax=Lachnellula suecica TaxID=602035 RepID=A0A8T9C3H0_9HELO|nr:Tannase [Lachnellula suecica]